MTIKVQITSGSINSTHAETFLVRILLETLMKFAAELDTDSLIRQLSQVEKLTDHLLESNKTLLDSHPGLADAVQDHIQDVLPKMLSRIDPELAERFRKGAG